MDKVGSPAWIRTAIDNQERIGLCGPVGCCQFYKALAHRVTARRTMVPCIGAALSRVVSTAAARSHRCDGNLCVRPAFTHVLSVSSHARKVLRVSCALRLTRTLALCRALKRGLGRLFCRRFISSMQIGSIHLFAHPLLWSFRESA
jgi:hypothetical protein